MIVKMYTFVLLLICLNSVSSNVLRKIADERELSPEVQKICNDYWDWRMSDMPQFATFVGIHEYDGLLDDMSVDAYFARYEKCQEFLQRANDLEPTLTTDEDIINIYVLKYELETYINSYNLKGYHLPMNYLEGPQVDMENQFGWMLKNTYDDYVIMIERMRKLPLQIDQIIELMEIGVDSNITYHEISMKSMSNSIGRFVVSDPTQSPFYVYFMDGTFPDSITPGQISSLQTEALTVIDTEVTPAYTKLLDYVINEYITRQNIAVTTMQDGDDYYTALIWFHTSTEYTPQEIQDIGFSEVDRIEAEMLEIVQELGYNMTTQEFSNMIRDDSNNYYNNSDDLMDGFEYIVYDLVPPLLPDIFKNIPEAELTVVADPSPDSAGAFYLAGSYDGSRPGVFYVNTYDPNTQPKYNMLTLSLHEGNPGHHLQSSHSIESPDFPYFRRVMEDRNYGIAPSRFPMYTYYVEGWALYSEALGFDLNLYEDLLDRYGHYSEEIFRACRLVVDTGIHALGWTRDEAIDYMFNHTASARGDIENEIDRYITWPGQALAYKMGELKIEELRRNAEDELEDTFDIKDFHDVVLNAMGPMNIVEYEVNKWINETLNATAYL